MNAVGLIPLAIATIGCAYAGLMLRDPARHDTLWFGVLVLVDALMTAWRGLNVLTGGSMVSMPVLIPCTLAAILLSVLTYEFITAFPNRAPMRWRWRSLVIGWSVLALVLARVDFDGPWGTNSAIELFYLLPSSLVLLVLCAAAYRRTPQRDARIVIAMLSLRWLSGLVTYCVAPLFGLLEEAIWLDTTVSTTIAFVVIGTAVLRTELFSLQNAAAEVVTISSIAMFVMLGAGGAIWASLTFVEPGQFQLLALVGASLVPLVLTAAGWKLYPRVERRVLAGLDERRARRLNVQGDPLPADAASAIAEASKRISTFGEGSTVRWVRAVEVPENIASSLNRDSMLRSDEQKDLPACFIVPAFGAERALVGAFYISGGIVDRDTYLVARDLAARVALSVERAQAVSDLEDARRLAALGQFAAAIAHDIRTPLTSISLNVQILRRKLQLPDDDREHLDIALEELARLDKSVAEILDFAKPVKLAAEEIDVGELLENAAKGLVRVLSERGLALRYEPARDLTVHGDPDRLRQVLANLVGNAADASKPGAEITVRAAANEGQIAIEVEDRGRGIGADDLPRIFEPFFTTRPDGTGLGLAICHKVVRAHGGDIRVRSTPGEGSTFTVLLPTA
ncbi:MAG: ATP-binding protein [Kofleriaceae bacterium]|nr:ATP-binding protein [Kofleriaceae bacterium]